MIKIVIYFLNIVGTKRDVLCICQMEMKRKYGMKCSCVCVGGGGGVVSGLVGGSSNALPFANTGAIIES